MQSFAPQGAFITHNWRIPKACQICRARKIRCDGRTPCERCTERGLPCEYRSKARQRQKKSDINRVSAGDGGPAPAAREQGLQGQGQLPVPDLDWSKISATTAAAAVERPHGGGTKAPTPTRLPHSSVMATHLQSPGQLMQLYYGPTSTFSLMQTVYRGLIPGYAENMGETARGDVEEGSAGLDMFQFRNIFFGISESNGGHADGMSKNGNERSPAPVFVPYPVAKALLQRFLLTLYHLMPFHPKEAYMKKLDELYNSPAAGSERAPGSRVVLVAIAIAALNTEHHRLADLLYGSVTAEVATMNDIVNVEMVQEKADDQEHALFQNEKGHPNSAFLHLGNAGRKAICAGLHKVTSRNDSLFEETQRTFWSLYIYEVLVSFLLGRPSFLSWLDIEVPVPKDPFLSCLIRLTQIMSKSANNVYDKSHDSFTSMQEAAASVHIELEAFGPLMQQSLGVRIDSEPLQYEKGVCQTMLTTLYNHTLLLTYRPFLILRGKSRSQPNQTEQEKSGKFQEQRSDVPRWLDNACGHAIIAARDTIHHISKASCANPLIQELRYNAFFIGSSVFVLVYDMLHDRAAASAHLPWINVGYQTLSAMRKGEPITGTMRAINLVLNEFSRVERRQAEYGALEAQRECVPCPPAVGGGEVEGSRLQDQMFAHHTANPMHHGDETTMPFVQQALAQPTGELGESSTSKGGDLSQEWKFDPSAVNLEEFFSWPLFDPCM
ncbi:hypothetical protein BJY04DRAFT_230299 [Aspergillus karnatakaensis]|uniref:Zn(II)2Cys6 transcription factor n=1 Tax=Aspergillus karnatakaensis TaxID=1810916 RepID=UPI003CCD48EA